MKKKTLNSITPIASAMNKLITPKKNKLKTNIVNNVKVNLALLEKILET